MRSPRAVLVWLLVLLASPGCGRARRSAPAGADTAAPPRVERREPKPREPTNPERVLLMTGFDPFGSVRVNPSWEGVRAWHDRKIGGLKVVALRLPVVWQAAGDRLDGAISKHKPVAVACFGAGRPGAVAAESVARNSRLAGVPDNDGKTRPAPHVVAGGEARYVSGEPLAELVKAVRAAGIDARHSDDAGTYLCNEVFYRLEHRRHRGPDAPIAAVFVHVPAQGSRLVSGRVFDREAAERVAEVVGEFLARRAAVVTVRPDTIE